MKTKKKTQNKKRDHLDDEGYKPRRKSEDDVEISDIDALEENNDFEGKEDLDALDGELT